MKYRNKITILLLSVLLVTGILPQQVKAEGGWPQGPDVSPSEGAFMMEMDTGTVLYDKNATEAMYPASITKVMTVLVALENSTMDEIVTFSADAVFKNEGDTSHISRDLGEEMTMEQCLYAVMLESANECAYAVAEHVGTKIGTGYASFIEKMNEKAKELGCVNTHFSNPNGLHADDHWTCPHDMGLIGAAAYKNENFRIICGTRRYVIPPTNKHADPTPLNQHHAMISDRSTIKYLYEHAKGGKTGFTDQARNTLITFAEKDGMKLVCVIMKSSNPLHYQNTTDLFEWGFNNFQKLNIAENEQSISEEKLKDMGILNTNQEFVSLSKNASIVLPNGVAFSEAQISREDNNSYGSKTLARLKYVYEGRDVGSAEIEAKDVKVEDSIFEAENEGEDKKEVVTVQPIVIIAVIVGLAILAVLIFLGKKCFENRYIIKHNRSVRKMRRERFREIKKENGRKRRKKDRLFK